MGQFCVVKQKTYKHFERKICIFINIAITVLLYLKYSQITKINKMPEQNMNIILNSVHSEPIVDNSLLQESTVSWKNNQKIETTTNMNMNANYEELGNLDVKNGLENETLTPIDYIYKSTLLPLIFVNTCTSGISLKEQYFLVKADIEQVITYFVDGNITPNDASIAKFFRSNPGTMIYSPQLVRTIISLEHSDHSIGQCGQLTKNKFHEE